MADNYITIHDKNGSINISEDVLTEMVRNSILETEGVAGISAVAGAELAELIGIKNINKGLNVYMNEDVITADAVINVKYGSCFVHRTGDRRKKRLHKYQRVRRGIR